MRKLVLVLTLSLGLAVGCRTNQTPGTQVEDARITTTLKARLASDLSPGTITNVDVNSTNGVVTLSGQVDTAENKTRAEEIARKVEGVSRVNNNLQVAAGR